MTMLDCLEPLDHDPEYDGMRRLGKVASVLALAFEREGDPDKEKLRDVIKRTVPIEDLEVVDAALVVIKELAKAGAVMIPRGRLHA
jgi:hypothetical protein